MWGELCAVSVRMAAAACPLVTSVGNYHQGWIWASLWEQEQGEFQKGGRAIRSMLLSSPGHSVRLECKRTHRTTI